MRTPKIRAVPVDELERAIRQAQRRLDALKSINAPRDTDKRYLQGAIFAKSEEIGNLRALIDCWAQDF